MECITGYRAIFDSRNTGLSYVSTFIDLWSDLFPQCRRPHGSFIAVSALENTTVLSCFAFCVPPSPFPLLFSLSGSFPNVHITTVGHFLPNRLLALLRIGCFPWLIQRMTGCRDIGWPSNLPFTRTIDNQLCPHLCDECILRPQLLPLPWYSITELGNAFDKTMCPQPDSWHPRCASPPHENFVQL